MTAEIAIRRFQRNLTFGTMVKITLLSATVLSVVVGPLLDSRFPSSGAVLIVAGIWLFLSYRSARGASMASFSPSLIAAGQFEEAEKSIEQSLTSFSLFRVGKIMSLHHLALLRHAQRRWADAAMLCQALLRQPLRSLEELSRQSLLILADSQMELGDLRGVHANLLALYGQKLTLNEALNLMLVQLDYESRIGAWSSMMHSIETKVQLAELMPPPPAAKAQTLLALAARRSGRDDCAKWLVRRVKLLGEADSLAEERPAFKELFSTGV